MRYRHYGERAAIYLAALEPNRQRQKSHLRAPKLALRQSHPARLRRCTNVAVMIRTGIRISDAALFKYDPSKYGLYAPRFVRRAT